MGFYMEVLILGTIILYVVSASFKLFRIGYIGLMLLAIEQRKLKNSDMGNLAFDGCILPLLSYMVMWY